MPSEPGALPSVRPSVVLLGVDSGGSHTSVAVGDAQGRVLARAEGPGSAMRPGGAERSAAVIFDVAGRAATEARASLPAVFAVVGAAGAGSTPQQEALAAALTAAGVATRVNVRPDIEIALAGAFGDGPGILINAGTGSIACARATDGTLHRAAAMAGSSAMKVVAIGSDAARSAQRAAPRTAGRSHPRFSNGCSWRSV